MDFAKSNALSLLARGLGALAQSTSPAATSASAPIAINASPHPTGAEAAMLGLVSLGLCALVIWILRRAVRPAKVSLTNTPGRPNALNPAHVLILLLLWQLAGGAAASLLSRWWPQGSQPLRVLAGVIQQIAWLGTSLVVAAVTFRHGLRRGMGLSLRHWLYDTGRGVFAYLAVLPICFGLFFAAKAVYWSLFHEAPGEHQMLVALREVAPPWQAMVIVSAVVLAPLAEEVFCRGVLQSMFRRYTARPWAGVVLASLVFALLHWNSLAGSAGAGWVQLPAMFVLGIVLGYNYERSGRLVAPIVIHVLFNGVNVALALSG